MLTLEVQRVIVKCKTIYTCTDCGQQERGDTYTTETPTMPNLQAISRHVSNYHMPYDWAGYGIGVVRCPNCKR